MLVSPDGRPLLTDFGLSRIAEASHTLPTISGASGTTRWMARELFGFDNPRPTPASDVWALGMTIYVRRSFHGYYPVFLTSIREGVVDTWTSLRTHPNGSASDVRDL